MEADALPYTLIILLAEFAIGSLWITVGADIRGLAARGFVKFGALTVVVMAAFAFWAAAAVSVPDEVGGFTMRPEAMGAARALLLATFISSIPYAFMSFGGRTRNGLATGVVASALGLATVVALALVFSPPTWGYAAVFLSLVLGSLAIGAVSMGMILGHWYLVTPQLPEKPLREVTLFLVIVIAIQGLLLVPNLLLPVRVTPEAALDVPMRENIFFWLRISGGLAFPWLLALMAWESSSVRAMQSATGLLYIAMALVLSGEVVGKGLLFATAVPA